MSEEKPTEETKQSIDQTEQRLLGLENIHEKIFTLVKWSFGTLLTFTLVLVAGNYFTSKSNYERDQDQLKQQVQLLKNQLDLAELQLKYSDNIKFTDMQFKMQESFASISNNLLAEVSTIERTNNIKWQQISALLSDASTNLSRTIMTNLSTFDSQIRGNVFDIMSNNIANINSNFIQLQKVFNAKADGAIASSLMVQARNTPTKDLHGKQSAFRDYILSASYNLQAGDELNAINAIKNLLNDNLLENYLNNISKDNYKTMEAAYPIANELNFLVSKLNGLNTNGRYSDELKYLQYYSNLITDKLSK
jgi:hypothetical protein